MMSNDSNKVKVYLAGPFFNEEQIDRVKRVEDSLKANDTVAEFFSPRLNQTDTYAFGTTEWRKEVFNNDVNHILWADVIVALHDFNEDNVDSGTAWELGYSYSINKPIILIQEKDCLLNLMLSDSLHAFLKHAEDVANYDFNKMPKIEYTGQVI